MSLKPLCQDCCRKTSQNSLKALLWRRHRETSLMSLKPILRRFCGMRRSAHSLQLLLATGQNPFPQYVRAFLTTNSIWRKSIHNLVSANQQRIQLMLRRDHKALLSLLSVQCSLLRVPMINSESWLPTTLKSESRVVWEWAIRCLYASLYPSHAWLTWAQTQFASDSKAPIHMHGARPLSSVPSLLCVSLSGAHLCAAFGPGPVIDAHFTLTNYHHITLACPSPRWTLPIVFWPVPISYIV